MTYRVGLISSAPLSPKVVLNPICFLNPGSSVTRLGFRVAELAAKPDVEESAASDVRPVLRRTPRTGKIGIRA